MFYAPTKLITGTRDFNIVVAGTGGTGSELLSLLAKHHNVLQRLGHAGYNITAFDPDTVSESNIGRQNFYDCDVGFNKADVLIHRFNSFCGTNWRSKGQPFTASHAQHCDLLFTCVDSAKLRADIGKFWKKRDSETLWIDGGNDERNAQIVMGHLGKCDNKLPNVFDLFPQLSRMKDRPEASCSTEEAIQRQDLGINTMVALMMANMLWQLVRHGRISFHGQTVDLQTGCCMPLGIDPAQWAMYGYERAA